MRDVYELRDELERTAAGMGAVAFGVADLSGPALRGTGAPSPFAERFSRGVVLGMRLQRAVLDDLAERPTPLYLHHYRQTNYQLDRAAWTVADALQRAGSAALAVPASQLVQRDPQRGHLSHRRLGWAAGIGFIGRSTLLVHPRYGAQMRYVSVLTDAPLPAGIPVAGDCGSCRACLEACPARAIGERAEDFNREACCARLNEFSRLPFIGQHICGLCVKACLFDGSRR
ncbi:MAG: epoxyqueuosine reductase [Lentisphaerae bacterium]|nr:epoxyqueuosine reductase [Lentisphaerota bacterium]